MKVYHWVMIALLLVIAGQGFVRADSVLPVDIQMIIDHNAGVALWIAQAEWCDARWGCNIGLGMAAVPLHLTDFEGRPPVVITVPVTPTPTWAVPTGEYMTHTPTPGEPTQEPGFIFTPTPTLTITPTVTSEPTLTPSPTSTVMATVTITP